jgi:copper(I)-binding protein
MSIKPWPLLAAILAACLPALSHASCIKVADSWAPPSYSQANAAAYVTLRSDCRQRIRLKSASANNVAGSVELHTHITDAKGVIRMRQVKEMTLKPGERLIMQPGSKHVMLMGLTRKLADGEDITLTLNFTGARPLSISIPISSARLLAYLKSRNTSPHH